MAHMDVMEFSMTYRPGDAATVFSAFDRDGNGVVSMDEFAQVLRFLRPDLCPTQIEGIFAKVDKDPAGGLSAEALHRAVLSVPALRLAGNVMRLAGPVCADKNEFQARLTAVRRRRELGDALRRVPAEETASRLLRVVVGLLPEAADEVLRSPQTRALALAVSAAPAPANGGAPRALPPCDSSNRALARAQAKASELRTVFETLDRDGSGLVSRAEFLSVMRFMSPAKDAARAEEAFARIDSDKSGDVSFAELAAVLSPDVGSNLRLAVAALGTALRARPEPAAAAAAAAAPAGAGGKHPPDLEARRRLLRQVQPAALLAVLRQMVAAQAPEVLDAVGARYEAYLPAAAPAPEAAPRRQRELPRYMQPLQRGERSADSSPTGPMRIAIPGASSARGSRTGRMSPRSSPVTERTQPFTARGPGDYGRRSPPRQRRSSDPSVTPSTPQRDRSPSPSSVDDPGAGAERRFRGIDDTSRLVRFWQGTGEADCVCGCARLSVDGILAKRGKYPWLEGKHHYVQWLFPKAVNGVSGATAPPLTAGDAAIMAADPECDRRLTKAYDMMLDFWGLELVDDSSGEVRKAPHWEERFANIEKHDHNYLRISRVLISLNMRGRRAMAGPLVELLLGEVADGNLPGARSSLLKYWIPCVKGAEGQRLRQAARDRGLVADESPYFRSGCRAALR
eukprot:TRINITY_DN1352_c3_g1_i1.p1 TRINITY_DN1352_c3_g1~~TRINITY_DN1352_c3_g1_i1.p1  ORF type:complete len:681 (+),score=221.24 TRINITY_DN1352_c3_g1_i1:94-2136(+)